MAQDLNVTNVQQENEDMKKFQSHKGIDRVPPKQTGAQSRKKGPPRAMRSSWSNHKKYTNKIERGYFNV